MPTTSLMTSSWRLHNFFKGVHFESSEWRIRFSCGEFCAKKKEKKVSLVEKLRYLNYLGIFTLGVPARSLLGDLLAIVERQGNKHPPSFVGLVRQRERVKFQKTRIQFRAESKCVWFGMKKNKFRLVKILIRFSHIKSVMQKVNDIDILGPRHRRTWQQFHFLPS